MYIRHLIKCLFITLYWKHYLSLNKLGDSVTSSQSTDDFFDKLDNNHDGRVEVKELIEVSVFLNTMELLF
jgi:hypothetical protein